MNNKSLEQENYFLKEMIRTYYQPEIEMLENIIKEVREYIENKVISNGEVIDQLRKIEVKELLEILDKENK